MTQITPEEYATMLARQYNGANTGFLLIIHHDNKLIVSTNIPQDNVDDVLIKTREIVQKISYKRIGGTH